MLNPPELNAINCVESQDNEPIEIIENLYIGSCFASYNKEALIKRNVKYIVNCSGEDNLYGHEFVYLHVRVKDKEFFNFLTSLYYSVSFIAEGLEKGSVFVYCSRGRCRSVSTIIGFLMTYCQMSFDDALHLLQSKRPQMKINDSFLMQLRFYYECNCIIHLSSQLFMLYQLTSFHHRFHSKECLRKLLKQYQSLIPASVELCYPGQPPHLLALPRYIAKQFHCSHCRRVLFRYHNVLDHRNIHYPELYTALQSLITPEASSSCYPVHCNPAFLQDSLLYKTPLNQRELSPFPSFSDLQTNISQLQLAVGSVGPEGPVDPVDSVGPGLSLGDVYPTGETFSHPPPLQPTEEITLSPFLCSVSPTLCEGLNLPALASTIELSSRSRSFVPNRPSDCLHSELCDSSQEIMSAPESTMCSPIHNPTRGDYQPLHLTELEKDRSEGGFLEPFRSKRESWALLDSCCRTRVKRSIFDDVDEDDENLDSLIYHCSKSHSLAVPLPAGPVEPLRTQSGSLSQSPSPPMFGTDSAPMNHQRIQFLSQMLIDYEEDQECDKVFVEPMEWMIQQVLDQEETMGELVCPNPECKAVIGGYNLVLNQSCTCGFAPFTYFFVFKNCTL